MLLVDTSAWIDFLRAAQTTARLAVRDAIARGEDLVTTEPIIMELLAGGDSQLRRRTIEALVNGLPVVSVDPRLDFRTAASVYLDVRATGRTPRNLVDCLIAAVAIRNDVTLWHKDADFEAIAACTPLRTEPLYG